MPTVYSLRSALVLAAALMTVIPAAAQQPRPAQPPAPQQPRPAQPPAPQQPAAAPIKPYTAVAITLATPSTDQSFAAFRTQLADIAKKKDRAALAKLVVAQGFFWNGESGDKADKKKPAIANLEQALGGFSGAEAQGWGALALAATDPTLEPLADHAGVMCGPAGPKYDEKAFEALAKATGTEPGDWAFPVTPNLEVRAGAQPTAPVIEKLGMHLVRVLPEAPPQGNAQPKMPTFARIVTPSGKTGFVPIQSLSPTGFDQICYIKDASGWKITGYESLD